MKHLSITLILVLALLTGCGSSRQSSEGSSSQNEPITITDWDGKQLEFSVCPQQVVALSGSLGEVWLNAGGTLVGTTDDAVTTRKLDLPDSVTMVGSIKAPDLEAVLSLNPDFVILDADIENHRKLIPTLEEMNIPCGLFHEEYFEDYLAMLEQFSTLTGCKDCLEKNGRTVQKEIQNTLSHAPDCSGKTVLLLRAYSSGFKAKGSENLAGVMLKDFGLENVLDKYDTLLEELSMEEIMSVDPDYIFVTTMGNDTQAALDNLEAQLCSNPAWGSLTAVKEDHFHVLPKDLFHYKPNARWNEAYAYLADLLSAQTPS